MRIRWRMRLSFESLARNLWLFPGTTFFKFQPFYYECVTAYRCLFHRQFCHLQSSPFYEMCPPHGSVCFILPFWVCLFDTERVHTTLFAQQLTSMSVSASSARLFKVNFCLRCITINIGAWRSRQPRLQTVLTFFLGSKSRVDSCLRFMCSHWFYVFSFSPRPSRHIKMTNQSDRCKFVKCPLSFVHILQFILDAVIVTKSQLSFT